MSIYVMRHLAKVIDELEEEISKRGTEIDDKEAQIYLRKLTLFYEQFTTAENKLTMEYSPSITLQHLLEENRSCHMRCTCLEVKLAKIISRRSSKSSTETHQNNPCDQTNQPKRVWDSDLQLQTQEQKFLIKQIESVEINDTVCAVKAQVLYDHVEKLYQRFISNQVQIDAQVDDAALLVDQQTIASQTQQKVIDIQTRLKKVITSKGQVSNSATQSEPSNQFRQMDETSYLNCLIKKQISFLNQMKCLGEETAGGICADKAKVMYNHLTSVYEMFVSNQVKIEEQNNGATLDAQRKISTKAQRIVIQMQTSLKKIFDPIPSPSFVNPQASLEVRVNALERGSDLRKTELATVNNRVNTLEHDSDFRKTELATVNNLINLINELVILSQNQFGRCINETGSSAATFSRSSSTTTIDSCDHLENFKNVQDGLISLQTKLNEMESYLKSNRSGQGNADSSK